MRVNLINSIDDIVLLHEQDDLECKLAAGHDGTGKLPDDFWRTYSAFANTNGGTVLLGIRESEDNQFQLAGIVNVAKVRKELFDTLNNRTKVSTNLLQDSDVEEITLDGKSILSIRIPRATRKQRPVYLTLNPLGGHVYRRLNSGDCALSDEDVKRMLAEQLEDSRDTKILTGFRMADLHNETILTYRQIFATRDPGHVWNACEDIDFLREIGAWGCNRETGEEGPTLAGLLMFGKMSSIQDELPNYMLDYREISAQAPELRWLDRLTLDGKWSGNLYDFYRKVYTKLTADLKVPFIMEHGQRKDESPVHEALREALANVLVHADYSDRASVLIVKRADFFSFRNPGLMRIPIEDALRGGESDCRNRTLHKMFRFVGIGEQAGTGIPKILRDWRNQQWLPPHLLERTDPYNQTWLELRMVDLFPKETMAQLRAHFGGSFDKLSEVKRMALVLAATEKTLTHQRLHEVRPEHRVDLSGILQDLVQNGFLETTGGRHAVYHLKGQSLPSADDVLGPPDPSSGNFEARLEQTFPRSLEAKANIAHRETSSSGLAPSFSGLASSFSGLASSSSGLEARTPANRDAFGRIINELLPLPVIDELSQVRQPLKDELLRLATRARTNHKLPREELRAIILSLCQEQYICLKCLSELVCRKPGSLRNEHLSPMVNKEHTLALAFPKTPTHERQAYGRPLKEAQ